VKASRQIDNLAKMYNTHFQLGLGDNFYFEGVTNKDDTRFNSTFENVFTTDYQMTTPWFMIAGNHDHYGNASAEVEYTDKSNRWIYPSFNYSIDIQNKNNDDIPFIKVLSLDTILLCGQTSMDESRDQTPKFNSKEEETKSKDYWIDIENQLKNISDKTPYVLVTGHYPVWSISEHGPTKCLVDKLRPLLHKYKVSAYICGHDHNLQHLTESYMNHTVEYILSGASNFNDNSTKHADDVPKGSLKFHWNDPSLVFNGGFALLRASQQNLTFTFFETDDHNLYQKVIYPRN
jgi:tartrate-resistant acid phosphatase type 5